MSVLMYSTQQPRTTRLVVPMRWLMKCLKPRDISQRQPQHRSHSLLTQLEKILTHWKGPSSTGFPQKGNIPEDPSTWRGVSLLSSITRCFWSASESLSSLGYRASGTFSSKQRAYIEQQGMDERVVCLKAAIECSCFCAISLDFGDAFGSLRSKAYTLRVTIAL